MCQGDGEVRKDNTKKTTSRVVINAFLRGVVEMTTETFKLMKQKNTDAVDGSSFSLDSKERTSLNFAWSLGLALML